MISKTTNIQFQEFGSIYNDPFTTKNIEKLNTGDGESA